MHWLNLFVSSSRFFFFDVAMQYFNNLQLSINLDWRSLNFYSHILCLNLGHALTGEGFDKNMVSNFIFDQDSCFIRDFQVNNINPLNAIKMHLKCHMVQSFC